MQISTRAFRSPGVHLSPSGNCRISLEPSPLGGALRLSINGGKDVADDVTGAVWLGGDRLAYSVSPIYGRPGLYLLDCASKSTDVLESARTINSAYPEGADYFELLGSGEEGTKLYFYYAPDVDVVDFATFRNPKSLFEVPVAGGAMRRVPPVD